MNDANIEYSMVTIRFFSFCVRKFVLFFLPFRLVFLTSVDMAVHGMCMSVYFPFSDSIV